MFVFLHIMAPTENQFNFHFDRKPINLTQANYFIVSFEEVFNICDTVVKKIICKKRFTVLHVAFVQYFYIQVLVRNLMLKYQIEIFSL